MSEAIDENIQASIVAQGVVQAFRRADIAIFCGAGISVNSGVPAVRALLPFLMDQLGMSPDESNAVMNSGLPFEVVMDKIREQAELAILLGVFRGLEPNANHRLFAELARQGLLRVVATTNFDQLLEAAFDASRMRRGTQYDVFHDESGFEKIDWARTVPTVIKIHGSVEDSESMLFTIDRVARQVRSPQMRAALEHVFLFAIIPAYSSLATVVPIRLTFRR